MAAIGQKFSLDESDWKKIHILEFFLVCWFVLMILMPVVSAETVTCGYVSQENPLLHQQGTWCDYACPSLTDTQGQTAELRCGTGNPDLCDGSDYFTLNLGASCTVPTPTPTPVSTTCSETCGYEYRPGCDQGLETLGHLTYLAGYVTGGAGIASCPLSRNIWASLAAKCPCVNETLPPQPVTPTPTPTMTPLPTYTLPPVPVVPGGVTPVPTSTSAFFPNVTPGPVAVGTLATLAPFGIINTTMMADSIMDSLGANLTSPYIGYVDAVSVGLSSLFHGLFYLVDFPLLIIKSMLITVTTVLAGVVEQLSTSVNFVLSVVSRTMNALPEGVKLLIIYAVTCEFAVLLIRGET